MWRRSIHGSRSDVISLSVNFCFSPSVIPDLIGDPVSLQWYVTIIIDGYRKVNYGGGS